jgi:hypothetical protein
MAIATPLDVQTSLMRTLTASESQYVEDLLARAEALLLVRIPTLAQRADTEPNFKAIVVMVEAEAVARVFRNPSAYRQESEGNYSYALNFEVASGLLDILGKEWERLGATVAFGSIGPATDGYLATRNKGIFPELLFQEGWGGGDQLCEPAFEDGGPP